MKKIDREKQIFIQKKREKHNRKRNSKKKRNKNILHEKHTTKKRLRNLNEKIKYNKKIKKRKQIIIPKHFSIHENSESTLKTLKNIRESMENGYAIKLDFTSVQILTIDTLLYLLAIINDIRRTIKIMSIEGTLPSNKEVKDLFIESGFLKYMKSTAVSIEKKGDVFQIYDGNNVDNRVVRDILFFVMNKLNIGKQDLKKLYVMIIEILANTRQHAYVHSSRGRWFVYARYDKKSNSILFSILDTGLSIPKTVKKNFTEKIQDIFKVKKVSDIKLLESALRGEFRTRTKKKNRGNGLPTIKENADSGYISDLTIVTRHALMKKNKYEELKHSLKGTLYFWRVSNGNN